MADAIDGIRVTAFEVEGIEPPGRVYAHSAYKGDARMVVAFNEPVPHDEVRDKAGTPKPSRYWSGLPVMFLYVSGFDEALSLARKIAEAHRAGNVDEYVGRWKRESEAQRDG